MSGFALIVHLDGGPVDRDAFGRVFAALDHRGPDGRTVRWLASAAVGHQHFWTTPEEVGESQPVADAAGRVHLVFDGRLDNRDELLAALDRGGEREVSDARLALWAYQRWGEACGELFLGPFAFAVVDAAAGRVFCARDPLGDRALFYHHRPPTLLVASEEQALLAHPAVSSAVNETTLARFFAVAPPREGETFFTGVRELAPAHRLVAAGDRLTLRRHWQADPGRRLRYRRDADYAEHFRELLRVSVACRLRSPAPPAVLMSGGLDSTTVAALAARELAAAGIERPLRAVSWVFDELAESDEREYIDRLVAAYGLEAVPIVGDDAWPLRDLATWPRNPNAPLEGVYRRLMERAYAAVRAGGGVTLLTGDGGDQLYSGDAYWLRDLLGEGRIAEAGGAIWRQVSAAGGTPWLRLRAAGARTLGWRRAGRPRPVWLTPAARARAAAGGEERRWRGRGRRPEQEASLLDPRSAYAASLEVATASRAGVDVRRPFRDRRLVEFALAIPAHQLYRPGWTRWVLRQATAGLLPDPVRLRRRPTSLLPLCARGLVEREAATVESLLGAPDALWPRYVRRDWLARVFPGRLAARADGLESVVAWRCICAELWRRAATGGGEALGVNAIH